MKDFQRAIDFVLKWEGEGPVIDMGGITKWGISHKAYPTFTVQEIKNLTKEQASQIYHRDYWIQTGCDKMPWPLSLCCFDTAVNLGVKRAKKFLEAAFENFKEFETKTLCESILEEREFVYRTLAKRNKYKPYLKGWLNRIKDLKTNL